MKTFMQRQGLLLAAILFSSTIFAQIPVSDCQLNGWTKSATGTATTSFVNGPATPPLTTGSGQLSVGTDGNSAAQFRTANFAGTLLSTLTTLFYSTYVQQDGSGGQAPYIILNVDYTNDGVADDFLFFEPLYQGSTFFPSNPQGPLTTSTWQTWNALTGGWWSVLNTAGAGPGVNVKSLATIIAAQPTATLVGSSLRLVAGFGAGAWDNFIGNVDNVIVGVSGSNTTYDFGLVVDNTAPVITCPANISNEPNDAGICGATVNVGTATATDNCSGTVTVAGVRSDALALTDVYPVGTTTITWTATDLAGNTASCVQTVEVDDVEDPVVTNVTATPNTLWAPNHKMVDVSISYTSTDNCGVISCIASVTSNEPVNGLGDANTDPDWIVVNSNNVKLRAERSGKGEGRIYTITITCMDAAGNTGSNTVNVTVAHDQSGKAKLMVVEPEMNVLVMPNPSNHSFNLTTTSKNKKDKISMLVSDVNGTVVYERANLSEGQTLSFGDNLKPGVYYVQMTQNGATTTTKFIKTK